MLVGVTNCDVFAFYSPFDKVGVINTFNVFGLADVSMAKRPEPEELSDDISVTEMKSTFSNAHFVVVPLNRK